MSKPTYLGDGVYASFDGWLIKLATQGNTIYLETATWDALLDYGNKVFFDTDTAKLNSESNYTIYGNCSMCGMPIADDEDVHDDYEGLDCHAACCPVCKDNGLNDGYEAVDQESGDGDG